MPSAPSLLAPHPLSDFDELQTPRAEAAVQDHDHQTLLLGPILADKREEAQGGEKGALPMNHTHRCCTECGRPVEARAPSCPQCGGTDLVLVDEPPVADLVAREQSIQAQHYPSDEEPMVRCAFCGQRIAAVKAFHSRYDGRAVCWTCKQAEEAHA